MKFSFSVVDEAAFYEQSVIFVKAGTHQTDFKELSAMKADSVVASRCRTKNLCLNTAQTTALCKLTRVFCACVRGVSCLYQQLSIVYILYSK